MLLHDELALLLRPAGGGIPLVSSGLAEQKELQRRLYGVATDDEVVGRWHEDLVRASGARAVLVGIPSDTGAGFRRGANLGPAALRSQLVRGDPAFLDRARHSGLVDVGDVVVVPQLLHDDMLSDAQKEATRAALYPTVNPSDRAALPVSPLSIAEGALARIVAANPDAAVIALGGDHSAAWPVVKALASCRPGLAVVQVDAHTDLLPDRLGVRHCFGTWSYHANDLLGRGGRLVQVGTRASRHDRAYWETSLGVRQVWAEDVRRDPARALDGILQHLEEIGAERVYLSNDIDGTDAAHAQATGTPEPGGLEPSFVVELIRRLGREVGLVGGDVMEVAPELGDAASAGRTLAVATRYLAETIAAALGIEPG